MRPLFHLSVCAAIAGLCLFALPAGANEAAAPTAPKSSAAQSAPETPAAVVTGLAEIAQYDANMGREQQQFLDLIQHKTEKLEALRESLHALARNSGATAPRQLGENYAAASRIWRAAVDSIQELFADIELISAFTLPAPRTQASFGDEDERQRFIAYEAAYTRSSQRRLTLLAAKRRALDNLKADNFSLLNDAGALRAALMQLCDETAGCERPHGLNAENLNDTLREIRAVPLRIEAGVLSKWLEVRAKGGSGLDGWLDLLTQAFVLMLIVATPFLINRMLHGGTRRLDSLRGQMLAHSMLHPRQRTRLAILIARLNPFIPSIGMILSLHLVSALLGTTDLQALSLLVTYLLLYFYYRATRLLLGAGLEIIFTTSSVQHLKKQKVEIEASARRISRLIYIELALLQVIGDTVRTGLIHNLFSAFIFWFNLAFLVIESSRWRDPIREAFAFRFKNGWARLAPLYGTRLGLVLPPLMLAAVIGHHLFRFASSRLVRLDFMKQLLSEIFKRRLNQAVGSAKPRIAPPPDYLAAFDYYLPARKDFFILRDKSLIEAAGGQIAAWAEQGGHEDLLLIAGDRGMGKTTILSRIADDAAAHARVITGNVPARTLGLPALFDWLGQLTGQPVNSTEDFIRFDAAQTRPLVLCVDEIHNLFLACIGGFAAYQAFLEIISLKTRNIFWCLTVNARSWSYLQGVFGSEHCYGRILEVAPWQDHEIQRLILARHELTGYRRTFDDSISAYAGGDSFGQQAETQFFRLLWGQSRGNPRSALMYWISAISAPEPKHIHVGVPAFIDAGLVGTMSDDSLFLFAAIVRHENLTSGELQALTEMDNATLRRNLKEASDRELVWFDPNGRVRISSRAQYLIDYFLIGKNFLHE